MVISPYSIFFRLYEINAMRIRMRTPNVNSVAELTSVWAWKFNDRRFASHGLHNFFFFTITFYLINFTCDMMLLEEKFRKNPHFRPQLCKMYLFVTMLYRVTEKLLVRLNRSQTFELEWFLPVTFIDEYWL